MSTTFGAPRNKRPGDTLSLGLSLWIADRFRPLLRALRVDYPRFRLVLECRLRLENAVNFGGAKVGAGMLLICLGALFSGIAPGVVALATHDPKLWMGLGQSIWMLFVGMLTLNHFGNVLIDGTDVGVLGSLPVDDRTVLASRIAHVMIDLGLLTACAAFFPTVLGCFAFSPLAVIAIYPLSTLLATFLVLGSISLGYAILLRALGPARFQRATLWTQIGGAVLVILAMQLAPRLVPWGEVIDAFKSRRELAIFVPPLHYEALFRVVQGQGARLDFALAAAALVVPLAFAWITFQLASRHFIAALTDSGAIVRAASRDFRSGWLARLGPRVCSTSVARAAYGFTLAMSRREKVFLRGVLPQAASFLAMGCGFVISNRGHARQLEPEYAPFALYYFALLSALVYELSRMSEHSNARWWFEALPVEHARELMEGGAKALLCGTILPIVLVAAVFVFAVAGVASLPDVVQALLGVFALATLQARWFFDSVPFTSPPAKVSGADRILKVLAALLLAGVVGAVHALSRKHWISQVVTIQVFGLLAVLGWRGLRTLTGPRKARRAVALSTP